MTPEQDALSQPSEQRPIPQVRFSHMGFFVRNLRQLTDFYTGLLGFAVTDQGRLEGPSGPVDLVFLSRDPAEHHQLVLCSGRPESIGFNTINQISFRVDNISALRHFYFALSDFPVSDVQPVTHGNAISVYFRDPEGNRIELFVDTPWYVTQPIRVPIDLTLDDSSLMKHVESHARSLPGFQPVEQWRSALRAKVFNAVDS